jgi:3',5'-cyclic AMP phosphodiesterase CpdA
VSLVVVGDVSGPALGAQAQTAALTESLNPDAILIAGDLQYPDGALADFEQFYGPTWGKLLARTQPVPGNHEYKSGSAAGYFAYFGARAGDPAKGYRSFDLGDWHVVALNTNHDCEHVACEAGSEQLAWLEADLKANPKRCVLAYWHHPRFSSGGHGDFTRARAIFDVLAANGVELVVNGHEHLYERLGPVNAKGELDEAGITQLTVGTGGIGFSPFGRVHPASRVREASTFGVVQLRLESDSWSAQFIGVPGSTFTDRASGACRDAPQRPQ